MKDDKYFHVTLGPLANQTRYTPESLRAAVKAWNIRPASTRCGENMLHGYEGLTRDRLSYIDQENTVLRDIRLSEVDNEIHVSAIIDPRFMERAETIDNFAVAIRGEGLKSINSPMRLTKITSIDVVDPAVRLDNTAGNSSSTTVGLNIKSCDFLAQKLPKKAKEPLSNSLGVLSNTTRFSRSALVDAIRQCNNRDGLTLAVYQTEDSFNRRDGDIVATVCFIFKDRDDKYNVFSNANVDAEKIAKLLSEGYHFIINGDIKLGKGWGHDEIGDVKDIALVGPWFKTTDEQATKQHVRENLTETASLVDMLDKFVGWGDSVGITTNGRVASQTTKLFEEAGEIASGICKSNYSKTEDGVGDVLCTLATTLSVAKINIANYLPEFKDVSEHELTSDAHEAMRIMMEAVSRVLTTLNTQTSRLAARLIKDDLEIVFYALHDIALTANSDLRRCAIAAWMEIKDRKGKFDQNGMFVKASDLK